MAIVENSAVEDLGRGFEKAPLSDHQQLDQADHGLTRVDQPLSPVYGDQYIPQVAANGHEDHSRHVSANGHKVGDEAKVMGKEMRDLQDLFSKLNPWAEEFVPPSLSNGYVSKGQQYSGNVAAFANGGRNGQVNSGAGWRRKKNFNQGKRRGNNRTNMAQRDEVIRRTVYVSDIDQQVTEEQLASLFVGCGHMVPRLL